MHTANVLPGVNLVVLDDYCPDSGSIPSDIIAGVNKLISDSKWTTLLISKGGVSMDGNPLTARGQKKINSDKVWLLTRPDSDSKRILWVDGESISLRLAEEGFIS